jgi:hypothetical protein
MQAKFNYISLLSLLPLLLPPSLSLSLSLSVVLGLELRAYTLSHSTSPFFVMGFFRDRSRELFAWAGFEPFAWAGFEP